MLRATLDIGDDNTHARALSLAQVAALRGAVLEALLRRECKALRWRMARSNREREKLKISKRGNYGENGLLAMRGGC